MANTAGNLDPWAVTRDVGNSIGNSALDARYTLGNLAQPDPSGALGWTDGVYPASASGSTILDLRVTAATPTPNMTAQIAPGGAQIGRLNQGPYQGMSTLAQTVTFTTSNPSNPRIDYVVMRTADPGVDSSPTKSWFPVVLAGTPAGSPLEPTGSVQDGDLLLAAVTIRTNTSQVLTGDISDRRIYTAARGSAYLKSAVDTRNGAYPGMMRYDLAARIYETWDVVQGAWVPVVQSAPWIAYTPALTIASSGQPISLGAGAVRAGRYQIQGKICYIHMSFVWGSAPYNGFAGNIISYLPSGIVISNSGTTSWLNAHLAVRNAAMVADFEGQAAADPNTNYVFAWFPVSTSNTSMLVYRIAAAQGVAGGGVPNVPGGFPEGGYLTIDGSFEIQ